MQIDQPIPTAGGKIVFSSMDLFCDWLSAHGFEIMRWSQDKITLRRRVGLLWERLELERI